MATLAGAIERAGFDGIWTAETQYNPFPAVDAGGGAHAARLARHGHRRCLCALADDAGAHCLGFAAL
jgi:alkanesulfonate monooxygenase SsuD/methylene tetrahydromethanopterin reductase-like flavin-dependent oxidoreductase (luciferase family)